MLLDESEILFLHDRTQKYPQFTDSYQVIFDTGYMQSRLVFEGDIPIPTAKVIVCSIRPTIQPAVLSSLAVASNPAYAAYPRPESQTTLFHERWLDGTNWLRGNYPSDPLPPPVCKRFHAGICPSLRAIVSSVASLSTR